MAFATGTNCWTKLEDRLAASLANSNQFQSWTGSANAAAAAGKVHIEAPPEPADKEKYSAAEVAAMFPLALVVDPEGNGISWNRAVQGDYQAYQVSSSKTVRFVAVLNTDNPLKEEIRTFKNAIGTIITELNAAAPDDDRFDHYQVTLSDRVNLKKRQYLPGLGEAIECEFAFNYEEGS